MSDESVKTVVCVETSNNSLERRVVYSDDTCKYVKTRARLLLFCDAWPSAGPTLHPHVQKLLGVRCALPDEEDVFQPELPEEDEE